MAKKITIYQLLPRLFGNTNQNCVPNSSLEVNGSGKFNDINTSVLKSIRELGITHIWYTGIIEHASVTPYPSLGISGSNKLIVKGIAGSPYAIRDYYNVDPDLAHNCESRLQEFLDLIDRTKSEGMGVIIDFVPNHLSRDYFSHNLPHGEVNFGERDKTDYHFHPNNNFYYLTQPLKLPNDNKGEFREIPAKATGNDCFRETPSIDDWYETVKLNYGYDFEQNKLISDPIPDTWIKMARILDFWAKTGVSGFRCDMVHMVPLEFWGWVIPKIKRDYPNLIFIAEIYEPNLYGKYLKDGCFDILYDKSNMYDTVRDIIESGYGAHRITSCWQNVSDNQDSLLNFLENHDEQRVASSFFASDPYRAIPAVAATLLLNRAPYMIYFGQELGERGMDSEGFSKIDGRTSIYDYWSVPKVREWIISGNTPYLRELYSKLLNLATNHTAITEGYTYDLMYANQENNYLNKEFNYSFIRYFQSKALLITVNFSASNEYLAVNIPGEFFTHSGIKEGSMVSKRDIFNDKEHVHILHKGLAEGIYTPRFGVSVIEFTSL